MDSVQLGETNTPLEQEDQLNLAVTLDSDIISPSVVDNSVSSTRTVVKLSKPKSRGGRPRGVKSNKKMAESNESTATAHDSKRPKRATRKTLKKAEADAQDELEAREELEDDDKEDETTLVVISESDSSDDTIDEERHRIQEIEAGSTYKRTYRGPALAPDKVLESTEQLDEKLEAALWDHCAHGREFDPIPAELNVEWACLVASLLDCTRFGDIKPSILNKVWGMLNYYLEGDANASSAAAAQFMSTIMIVNGQGFQDVKSLSRFYDPVLPHDEGAIIESFVTHYFDGDFVLFHEIF